MKLTAETQKEVEDSEEIKNLKKLEAALFISARWVSLSELVTLTDLNPLLLKELIEKLQDKYNTEDSSIEILKQENSWKMDVKQEYRKMINKLATGSSEFTRAEQETLAVIAYKQPVKQSIVVKIRGNKAYEHIKKFREAGLLNAKKTGHTYELNLSSDFYDYFSLEQGKIEKNNRERTEETVKGEEAEEVVEEIIQEQEKTQETKEQTQE